MVKLKDIAILGALAAGALFLIGKVKGKEEPPKEEPKDISIFVGVRPLSGVSPLTVGFEATINNARRPLRKVFWDFGDGDSSGFLNPSHTYTTNLQFEVFYPVISIEDAEGNTATGQGMVQVFRPPPEDLVLFFFEGREFMIPRSVFDEIQQIVKDFPNPFVQIEKIRVLLIPFGA